MSIVNFWRDNNHVMVAVDSHGRAPDGTDSADFSKVVMVPHTNCLLAARGERVLFGLMVAKIMSSPHFIGSYDDMVRELPGLFLDLARMEEALRANDAAPDSPMNLELFVMGWSEDLQRMAVSIYLKKPDEDVQVEEVSVIGGYITPCEAGAMEEAIGGLPFGAPSEQGFHADLVEAMKKQVAWGREEYPDVAFGGRIYLARLDRKGMSLDEIGEIP